ncbi:MAG: aminotransferase class I/II-fold pyridoxal phosphate-dependent enzyme [Myxococcota bacterium]
MQDPLERTTARARVVGVTPRIARDTPADGQVLWLRREGPQVVSFASSSYLGLERDPRLARGAIEAIERSGVAFGASRCFTRSAEYQEACLWLGALFGRPVVLAQSTALAHASALPVLLEASDRVTFDRQVHPSVQGTLTALAPRLGPAQALAHGDLEGLEVAIRKARAAGIRRVWYCADGVDRMFGDRLDTRSLRDLMARYRELHVYLDDAHGMSWAGTHGGGTLIDAGLPADRTVITTSLSKGFGAAGGVVVLPDEVSKERIEDLGPSSVFGAQLSPPVLGAIAASAEIHLGGELPALQRELAEKLQWVRRELLSDPGLAPRLAVTAGEPTPVHYVVLGDPDTATHAARYLLEQGISVNPVTYPAVPAGSSGLRFGVTLAHRDEDLRRLFGILAEYVGRLRPARCPRRRAG